MTLARDRPPGNVQHLERLIGELARELDQPALRLRTTLANTIVGQMPPEGAVKGGSAMKLRLGAVPSITAGPRWDTLYDAAADGVDVPCAEVTVAVDWANGLAQDIAAA